MSLLSGVILTAPGTLAAKESDNSDKYTPASKTADPKKARIDAKFEKAKKAEDALKDREAREKGMTRSELDAAAAGNDTVPAGKDATPVKK